MRKIRKFAFFITSDRMRMSWLELLLVLWIGGASLLWLFVGLQALRSIYTLAHLHEQPPLSGHFPKVSIIVPACNEEESLRSAQLTLLEQDYPNLEIILVNDRSSDRTGEIVEELAARDARVRPLHIRSLPDGWLGKTHALHCATLIADGEWLLFTDADVHYSPDALRRALAYAQERELDHLAALPRLHTRSFSLRVMAAAFGLHLLVGMQRKAQPEHADAMGVGAFNLLRRSAFAQTPGFAWLRLEVADDIGLAQMMAGCGLRSSTIFAMRELSLEWYRDVPAMIRGLEKNIFGVLSGYSYSRALAAGLGVCAYAMAPLAALVLPLPPLLMGLGLFTMLMIVLGGLLTSRSFGQQAMIAPLLPLGITLLGLAIFNAAWQAWRRGGIQWRTTRYRVEDLRAAQKVTSFWRVGQTAGPPLCDEN